MENESQTATWEREVRHTLRYVQDYLFQLHRNLGVQSESSGMVEIFTHPELALPEFNYVTPRRNTAWVPANMLKPGLESLAQRDRLPRVLYMEGIFPAQYSNTMRDLQLQLESRMPILVYKADGIAGQIPARPTERRLADGIAIRVVDYQEGLAHWWYVWRNSAYDVITLGVEPTLIGRDMEAHWSGRQLDLVLYRYNFPVGVARIMFDGSIAHLSALAIFKEVYQPAWVTILQSTALQLALERGVSLMIVTSKHETERRAAKELGFVHLGNMVCYTASQASAGEYDAGVVEQPVFAI